jgi:hypothetical protein
MTFIRRNLKLIGVAVSCAAIGAGASAIASAGAASTGSQAASAHPARARVGAPRALRRAVHGDLVVATKTGFASVTFDRGSIQSVSGQQLTLREGTKTATYKSVTLMIPTGALVRDNGHKSTLSALKQGQRALVLDGPKRTLVIAHDTRIH